MFGSKKEAAAALNWEKTKASIQILIGKSDEDLTDSELADAILENAKSQKTEPEASEKPEVKEVPATKEKEAETKPTEKSEFTLLREKIDLIAGAQAAQGKELEKIKSLGVKGATTGERDVADTKGKSQFDSKKDAPVFAED